MKPGSREVLLTVIAKTSDDKFARFPGPVLWFAEQAGLPSQPKQSCVWTGGRAWTFVARR
jgi:hypothetical protein